MPDVLQSVRRSRRLTRVLRRFLHHRLRGQRSWEAQKSATGTLYTTRVAGLGMFAIDAARRHVILAVFERSGRNGGRSVSLKTARRVAFAFAAKHTGQSLARWRLIQNGVRGGSAGDRVFRWQEQRDHVPLPSHVDVVIRRDGRVASYAASLIKTNISLKPRISRTRAATLARTFLHLPASAQSGRPRLIVLKLPRHKPLLAWVLNVPPATNAALSGGTIVTINARSGAASILAES